MSDLQIWSRNPSRATKQERNYPSLPIEQKESYKWLHSAESSNRCLQVGQAQSSVQLYAVEAQEVGAPTGQTPIHWRLLTTHFEPALTQGQGLAAIVVRLLQELAGLQKAGLRLCNRVEEIQPVDQETRSG